MQAGIRQRLAGEAAEVNRRMSLARAHDAWQAAQAERAASDQALKAEVRVPTSPIRRLELLRHAALARTAILLKK